MGPLSGREEATSRRTEGTEPWELLRASSERGAGRSIQHGCGFNGVGGHAVNQQSPAFSAPGTSFVKDNFSMEVVGVVVSGQSKHIPFIVYFISIFSIRIFESFKSLFLAALGFHCCSPTFSNCKEQGLLFTVVCGLLTSVTSHCPAWALESMGFSCYSTQA